jgi:quinol monooxygenase YgiN
MTHASSTPQLTVIAFLRARAGQEEELGRRLKALVAPTRQEAGCLNYDLHRSNTDPAVWGLYENWRCREDLDAHFKTDGLVQLVQDVPTLLDGEIEMHHLAMSTTPAPAFA